MNNFWITLYDEESKKNISLKECSEKTGIKVSLIRRWVSSKSIKTVKECLEYLKGLDTSGERAVKKRILNTSRGFYSLAEISKMTDTPKPTIAGRARAYGEDSETLWFGPTKSRHDFHKKLEALGIKSVVKSFYSHPKPKKSIKFDRNKVCNRSRITCKHYVECLTFRLDNNKHHERYKEDGSCYC